jgi:hypothetical protein
MAGEPHVVPRGPTDVLKQVATKLAVGQISAMWLHDQVGQCDERYGCHREKAATGPRDPPIREHARTLVRVPRERADSGTAIRARVARAGVWCCPVISRAMWHCPIA